MVDASEPLNEVSVLGSLVNLLASHCYLAFFLTIISIIFNCFIVFDVDQGDWSSYVTDISPPVIYAAPSTWSVLVIFFSSLGRSSFYFIIILSLLTNRKY